MKAPDSSNPNSTQMFSQFATTVESLTKASSLALRFGTDAHLYDDPDDVSTAPLLDSRFDSEQVEALKRLLALIAQGADVSSVFPQVPILDARGPLSRPPLKRQLKLRL